MAITATGGSATVSTTEFDLIANSTVLAFSTTGRAIQLIIDIDSGGLAAGDLFEVAAYEKVNAGTARRLVLGCIAAGDSGLFLSGTFLFVEGYTFTMKKLSGTDRTFGWSIRYP